MYELGMVWHGQKRHHKQKDKEDQGIDWITHEDHQEEEHHHGDCNEERYAASEQAARQPGLRTECAHDVKQCNQNERYGHASHQDLPVEQIHHIRTAQCYHEDNQDDEYPVERKDALRLRTALQYYQRDDGQYEPHIEGHRHLGAQIDLQARYDQPGGAADNYEEECPEIYEPYESLI